MFLVGSYIYHWLFFFSIVLVFACFCRFLCVFTNCQIACFFQRNKSCVLYWGLVSHNANWTMVESVINSIDSKQDLNRKPKITKTLISHFAKKQNIRHVFVLSLKWKRIKLTECVFLKFVVMLVENQHHTQSWHFDV